VERGDGDKKTSVDRKNFFLKLFPAVRARCVQGPVGGETTIASLISTGPQRRIREREYGLLQQIASCYIGDSLRRGNLVNV
jgi:hypothetical protein